MIYRNKRDQEAWLREKTLESLKANTFLQENDIVQVAETGKFYQVVSEETEIVLQNSLYAKSITNGSDKLSTPRNIAVSGAVSGNADFDGSKNITINTTLNEFDASKITSGTIDVSRLPVAALERCVIVQNDEERFALTKGQVQNGDAVKVISPDNIMYAVIDDNKLNSEEGYTQYSAAVKWETIKDKPIEFKPMNHNHNTSDIEVDNQNMFVSMEEKDKWNTKADENHNHDKKYALIMHEHQAEEVIESDTKKFVTKEQISSLENLNNNFTKKVTFSAGEAGTFADGQSTKIVKVLYGSSIPEYPEINPEFASLFYGWDIKPIETIIDKSITSDVVVTALYNQSVHQITFKCNEGGNFKENNDVVLIKNIKNGDLIKIPEMIVPISYEFANWQPELPEGTRANSDMIYTANFNFLGLNVALDDNNKLFEKKVAKHDEYSHIEYPNSTTYNEEEIFLD